MSDIVTQCLSSIGFLLGQQIFSYFCFGVLCFGLIYTVLRFIRGL